MRYDTSESEDGLSSDEGVFLACSFWLVDAYLLLDRKDEAHRLFKRLLTVCNDVGLLSEEYDPRTGHLLGNFPQALSHIALINSAFNLSEPVKPAKQRSDPPLQPALGQATKSPVSCPAAPQSSRWPALERPRSRRARPTSRTKTPAPR